VSEKLTPGHLERMAMVYVGNSEGKRDQAH